MVCVSVSFEMQYHVDWLGQFVVDFSLFYQKPFKHEFPPSPLPNYQTDSESEKSHLKDSPGLELAE